MPKPHPTISPNHLTGTFRHPRPLPTTGQTQPDPRTNRQANHQTTKPDPQARLEPNPPTRHPGRAVQITRNAKNGHRVGGPPFLLTKM